MGKLFRQVGQFRDNLNILKKRTEPFSIDNSTPFICIASVKTEGGKGFPTMIGVPINDNGVPFMAILDPVSEGIRTLPMLLNNQD